MNELYLETSYGIKGRADYGTKKRFLPFLKELHFAKAFM